MADNADGDLKELPIGPHDTCFSFMENNNEPVLIFRPNGVVEVGPRWRESPDATARKVIEILCNCSPSFIEHWAAENGWTKVNRH